MNITTTITVATTAMPENARTSHLDSASPSRLNIMATAAKTTASAAKRPMSSRAPPSPLGATVIVDLAASAIYPVAGGITLHRIGLQATPGPFLLRPGTNDGGAASKRELRSEPLQSRVKLFLRGSDVMTVSNIGGGVAQEILGIPPVGVVAAEFRRGSFPQ